MPKNAKRKREESSDEEEGYVVEVITKARVADVNDQEDGWDYLVKWAGYDSSQDSWEPSKNLAACQSLLGRFWAEIGSDDNDYPEGHVVEASRKWIKKERMRFKEEFAKEKDDARKEKERADRRKEVKLAAKKDKKKLDLAKEASLSVPSRSASTSSVSRSATHTTVASYPAPLPRQPPKKKTKMSLSDPGSDDEPLANLQVRKTSSRAGEAKKAKGKMADAQEQVKRSASASSITVSTGPKKTSESSSKATTPPQPISPSAAALARSLFPSPPPASPEISTTSFSTKPKPKLPKRTVAGSSNSIQTKDTAAEKPAASPTVSSTTPKATPMPLLKPQPPSNVRPLPLPNRRRSNIGSAPSSTPGPIAKTATLTIPTSAGPTISLQPVALPFPVPGKFVSPIITSANKTLASFSSSSATSALSPTSPNIPSSAKPPASMFHPSKVISPTITSAKPAATTISAAKKPASPVIHSAIPTHIQQQGSTASRSTQSSASDLPASTGSGLSTKSRLSQGALTPLIPMNPKEATKKNSFSGLSFKKHSLPGPATSGGSTSQARMQRPKRLSVDPLFDEPDDNAMEVDNPVSPHNNEPEDSAHSQARLDQAEEFIRSIASSVAPPTPIVDNQDSPQPPRPPTFSVDRLSMDKQDAAPLPRPPGVKPKMSHPTFKKKWKWTGKLIMDVGDKTNHLCDIVLNDLCPPHVEGLHLDVAMTGRESVHLLSFHDLVDMIEFLKTCVRMHGREPLHQLARLGPSTENDTEPLKILARYMTKMNLVSLVPVFLEGDLKGHLLLFTPVMRLLCRMLRVPDEMVNASSLIVVLLPWAAFPEESRRPFGLLPASSKPHLPSLIDWKKTMLNHKYQVALRVVKFPPALHEWMSKPNRTYFIWALWGQTRAEPYDTETDYLVAILNQCKATRAKFDFRVVFVHVGALKTIRRMPLLVDRRSKSCNVHFYSYGTHESVNPKYWGLREIYPCGGIVTFTASALYEDPWGIVSKIKDIDRHPLWMCYLLPSVLGMATRMCSVDDPLAAFDAGVFVFERLLKAIDDGEISLLRAPPLERSVSRKCDPCTSWLRDHWITRPIGPRRVLEFCMNDFHGRYSNVPQDQWASAVEAEISEDLDMMQRQPVIMERYRRYVAIKAESDPPVGADQDGFEWVTSSSFAFNDDFQTDSRRVLE